MGAPLEINGVLNVKLSCAQWEIIMCSTGHYWCGQQEFMMGSTGHSWCAQQESILDSPCKINGVLNGKVFWVLHGNLMVCIW